MEAEKRGHGVCVRVGVRTPAEEGGPLTLKFLCYTPTISC
jgi:hypothetical protein